MRPMNGLAQGDDSGVRGWVLVKGSGGGGLGDRLRAVIAALAYARSTDRGISVDWRDGLYGEPGVNSFPCLFGLEGIPSIEPEKLDATQRVLPAAWAGRLHLSMHEAYVEDGHLEWNRKDAIERYSFNLLDPRLLQDVLVMWDFDRLPDLARSLDFNPGGLPLMRYERDIVAKHLKPAEKIRHRVEELFRRDEGPACWIGVHVRSTRESARQKGKVSLHAYFDVLDRLIGTHQCHIFLATDNKEVELHFRDRYGDLASFTKWFGTPGDPLHLNADCPDPGKAAEDAVAEMSALANCDHLVLRGNSSFSMMARIFFDGDARNLILLETRQTLPMRLRRLARRFWC